MTTKSVTTPNNCWITNQVKSPGEKLQCALKQNHKLPARCMFVSCTLTCDVWNNRIEPYEFELEQCCMGSFSVSFTRCCLDLCWTNRLSQPLTVEINRHLFKFRFLWTHCRDLIGQLLNKPSGRLKWVVVTISTTSWNWSVKLSLAKARRIAVFFFKKTRLVPSIYSKIGKNDIILQAFKLNAGNSYRQAGSGFEKWKWCTLNFSLTESSDDEEESHWDAVRREENWRTRF